MKTAAVYTFVSSNPSKSLLINKPPAALLFFGS
jgi:hypothetical protein